jgi:ribosomal protein S27E
MTDNVVELFPKDEEPYITGEVKCLDCGNLWQGIYPPGTVQFQCPKCHTMRGVPAAVVTPGDGEIWACNCGCWAFCFSRSSDEWVCLSCGAYQTF